MSVVMHSDLDRLFTELVVQQQQEQDQQSPLNEAVNELQSCQMATFPEFQSFTSSMEVIGFPSPVSPEFLMDQDMMPLNNVLMSTAQAQAGPGMMESYFIDPTPLMGTAAPEQSLSIDETSLPHGIPGINTASMYYQTFPRMNRRGSMPQRRDSVASVAYSVTSDAMSEFSSDFPVSSLPGATQTGPLRRASVAGSSVFQCKEPGCFRTFNRLQNLKSHARCHLKVSPHTCPTCPHSFRRSTDLARHIRTVHASDMDKPWGCEACGKKFGRSDALKRHSASKSKLYGCPASRALEECDEENLPLTPSSQSINGLSF